MWKDNLGITVELFNQEWKVYLDNQRTKNYQIARARWIADYNDPNTFLDLYVTGGGNNDSGWSNKQYDALVAQAAKVTDPKARKVIFGQAEDILLDELPVIPVFIFTRVYLKSPSVQGWYNNVEDTHPLKFVSLK